MDLIITEPPPKTMGTKAGITAICFVDVTDITAKNRNSCVFAEQIKSYKAWYGQFRRRPGLDPLRTPDAGSPAKEIHRTAWRATTILLLQVILRVEI